MKLPLLCNRLLSLWRKLTSWGQKPLVRVLAGGLVFLISLIFLAYAIYVNRQSLQETKLEINGWLLFLSIVLYPLGYLPMIVTWHYLIRILGSPLGFWSNMRLYALSSLPKRIPGPMWHIASRSVLYKQAGVPHSATLLGTAVESVVLVIAGMLVYLASLGLSGLQVNQQLMWAALGAILLLAVALWQVKRLNQAASWLVKRSGTAMTVQLERRHLLVLVVGYMAGWVGGGIVLYVLARGVSSATTLTLVACLSSWAGAGVVSVIAQFTVANMGLRELALSGLLSASVPLSIAVVIAILFRILLMGGEFIWSLIFAMLARWVEKSHLTTGLPD